MQVSFPRSAAGASFFVGIRYPHESLSDSALLPHLRPVPPPSSAPPAHLSLTGPSYTVSTCLHMCKSFCLPRFLSLSFFPSLWLRSRISLSILFIPPSCPFHILSPLSLPLFYSLSLSFPLEMSKRTLFSHASISLSLSLFSLSLSLSLACSLSRSRAPFSRAISLSLSRPLALSLSCTPFLSLALSVTKC